MRSKEFIITLIIGAILLVFIAIKVVQKVGLEKIREQVYHFFIEAEREFQHGDNEAKFEYVVNLAQTVIPAPFNLFITEKLLREVIQAWFDLTKDLLDDGRLNGTSKEE